MNGLGKRIAQTRGDMAADIVPRDGQVFDIVIGDLLEGDLVISEDGIVGTCADYEGKTVINVSGLTLVPGFIDTHLPVESSLITPLEFDRCVTPLGGEHGDL